jgi:hypothetical protein
LNKLLDEQDKNEAEKLEDELKDKWYTKKELRDEEKIN